MKKHIKHTFKHIDPEKIKAKNEEVAEVAKSKKTAELDYSKSDLKKVLITIGVFCAILVVLYFLQQKTDFLKKITEIILK